MDADTSAPRSGPAPRGERLQKILARAGLGSRRACELLITDGRVTIDGRIANVLGVRADLRSQEVRVDGEPVRLERFITYALNKPAGFVCANRDPQGRPLAADLIQDDRRLYTVGRLDIESEGIILVTNDGDLANRLTHPRYEVRRAYQVKVQGSVPDSIVGALRRGVYLCEGRAVADEIRICHRGREVSTIEVVIHQGWNRQVRRMLAKFGFKVKELRRVSFGPIRLAGLPTGAYRRITIDELDALRRAAPHSAGPAPASSRRGARPSFIKNGRRPRPFDRQSRNQSRNRAT
jgi:23S rRNA pseudouridine2605 synthase